VSSHFKANISAALRTADCLGVQNVYIVLNKNLSSARICRIKQTIRSKISRGTHVYLNVKILTSFQYGNSLISCSFILIELENATSYWKANNEKYGLFTTTKKRMISVKVHYYWRYSMCISLSFSSIGSSPRKSE
jgi:hypothetical protein